MRMTKVEALSIVQTIALVGCERPRCNDPRICARCSDEIIRVLVAFVAGTCPGSFHMFGGIRPEAP